MHRMMSRADIFLSTSDYNEGWGVVINESMRQGCAVVASSAMGAVPFMIKDGINGFACRWNDFDKFYDCVKRLINDRQLYTQISYNAMKTIEDEYSPDVAADRFCRYCAGERFREGICSPAKIRKK
ncbi:glycosyltransferase family 4 protein [uncultured Bifidobacterium sp.]|uniref:glycosyltransferase n=1 Tax=uncultured Bifidobacterium sp. TaxID=165187 RepID=UPI0033906F81